MTTALTDAELELARLRGALETWRAYLAGPCGTRTCSANRRKPYDGHRHFTDWYETNRSTVVALNYILEGSYDYPVTLSEIGRAHFASCDGNCDHPVGCNS